MIENWVEISGQRIRVLEGGSGPDLLFLHGAGGVKWSPLLQLLSRKWRVIAPEHPGFGSSALPEWLMSVGDLAFFYRAFIRKLNLKNITVVGHSLGGWLATEMAIRSTDHIKQLVLLAPAGVASKSEPFPDIFLWTSEEAARRQFFDQSLAEKRIVDDAGADMAIQLQNKAALARLAWNPRLENPQLSNWLQLIDVPVLLVWGQNDEVVPFSCHESYMKGLPHAELRALPESGHALPVERAEAVDRHVTEFDRRAA